MTKGPLTTDYMDGTDAMRPDPPILEIRVIRGSASRAVLRSPEEALERKSASDTMPIGNCCVRRAKVAQANLPQVRLPRLPGAAHSAAGRRRFGPWAQRETCTTHSR
jgi:hypothetical protein